MSNVKCTKAPLAAPLAPINPTPELLPHGTSRVSVTGSTDDDDGQTSLTALDLPVKQLGSTAQLKIDLNPALLGN